MKVSFGKTYIVNEGYLTRAQKYIDNIACAAFAQEKDLFSADPNENKTIETLLEENKRADVFIKNKSDGSVTVEVIKKDSFGEDFVPYDAKGRKKLERKDIRLDLSSSPKEINKALRRLEKRFDNFSEKAREYAITPDNVKNTKLEERNYNN